MVTIAVDKTAQPLTERLELDVTMGDDLILSVTARSAQRKDSASESYFDLEFGIGLPGRFVTDVWSGGHLAFLIVRSAQRLQPGASPTCDSQG
jgi:hypothetical protein